MTRAAYIFLALALTLAAPGALWSAKTAVSTSTVANLPAACDDGVLITVTDAADRSDCSTGGGTTEATCVCEADDWIPVAPKPQALCKTLFDTGNLAATDDVPDLWIFNQAVTAENAKCISSGGTSITVTIEDDAGNDLTTSCVCATTLTDCTLTANDSFSADERADWTTVSVSGSVTAATMCLYVVVD